MRCLPSEMLYAAFTGQWSHGVESVFAHGCPRRLNIDPPWLSFQTQSTYLEKKDSWPEGIQVMTGKTRNSGFYLNKADPKGLLGALNASIDYDTK